MSGSLPIILLTVVVAQSAPALRLAAEKVIERIGAAGGRAAIVQIERAGGRAAVEAVLVRAEGEGGEALVSRCAALLSEAGAPALGVLSKAPARAIAVLDGLTGDALRRGVMALEREPVILTMPQRLARSAVATEVRHPGVGTTIVEALGDDGARVAAELTESQAVSLARWSKDVAALSAPERSAVVAALERRPGVILDYLDRHPGVLVAGAGVTAAAIVEMTALVSGQEGPVSAVVRGGTQIADEALTRPLGLTVTLAGIAAVVLGALWFLPGILRRWRRSREARAG